MGRPVECIVFNDIKSHAISDSKINRLMKDSATNKPLHDYHAYQLDTLLGSKGTELIIKLFNSIIISEKNILQQLKIVYEKEMEKLLLLNNINTQFDSTIFVDYFTLKIMVLINAGIYCRHNSSPDNFKLIVSDVMKNPSEENREKLIKSLDVLWDPQKAGPFIDEVVENLTIQYFLKNKLDSNRKEIIKTVSSYFLLSNDDTTTRISDKVLSKLEAYYA